MYYVYYGKLGCVKRVRKFKYSRFHVFGRHKRRMVAPRATPTAHLRLSTPNQKCVSNLGAHTHTPTSPHTNAHTSMHVNTHARTHVRTRAHSRAHSHAGSHTHAGAHSHVHTHANPHTHVHADAGRDIGRGRALTLVAPARRCWLPSWDAEGVASTGWSRRRIRCNMRRQDADAV